MDGGLSGAQIGFNYQVGSLVFGIEADTSWTRLEGVGSFNTITEEVNWEIRNQLDWFGTVRGRMGVSVADFLLYGTAGLAFGRSSADLVVSENAPPAMIAIGSAKEEHVGWAVGGGAEWLLSPNWSFKTEYLYTDLGSADYHLVGVDLIITGEPHTTDSFPADLRFHAIRLGLNYRF